MFPPSLIPTARWLLTVPLAGAALCAIAQTPATDKARPALTYRSAMEGYHGFADEKPIAWRDANEVVYRRGGWKAYAKEAEAAAPPEAGQAQGHAGHDTPAPHGATVPMPSSTKGQP